MLTLTSRVKPLLHRILQSRWVFRLIGIGIFVLILTRIDLDQLYQTLRTIDPLFLLLSLVLQAVALVVTTFRWQLIMHRLEIYVPFRHCVIQQLIGTAAGVITPGQLGEFIKVLYLGSYGYAVPESALSVVVDRLFDLSMLFLFGLIGLAVLFRVPPGLTAALATGICILVGGGLLFARNREKSAQTLATVVAKISPQAYKETVHKNTHHLAQLVGKFNLSLLAACALLSTVNYGLLLLRIYCMALSVHVVAPFWYLAMAIPLLRLVGLIPISISGIGTRDITMIYLLGRVGVPQEASLVLSILSLLTLQFQVLVGLMAWWRYPVQVSRGKGSSRESSPLDNERAVPGK